VRIVPRSRASPEAVGQKLHPGFGSDPDRIPSSTKNLVLIAPRVDFTAEVSPAGYTGAVS